LNHLGLTLSALCTWLQYNCIPSVEEEEEEEEEKFLHIKM
jgi:hypothetical protein